MNLSFENELDEVLDRARDVFETLRRARVFITGGTRFFGGWLLETLLRANEKIGLRAEAVILSRDPAAFEKRAPHLARNPAIRILKGDIWGFSFPPGEFSHLIHGAASLNTQSGGDSSLETLKALVDGTRRTLDFARQAGIKPFLYISSGAIYGPQPPELSQMSEEFSGNVDNLDPRSTYALGKRLGEHLCAVYHDWYGLDIKIARAFSFVGPHLPLDRHNAIGNFLRDGLDGGPIRITGDGTPRRSYLYGADLAVWLWTILTRGTPCRPYNVGSEEDVSINELAASVAEFFGTKVEVAGRAVPKARVDRYVPSTQRAKKELNLDVRISLKDAIRRTAQWYRAEAVGWP